MNLIQQADLLKQVPDQAIATELQRPTGQFPPYLVVAESQRRQKMRQDYEARAGMEKPKTTVAQDLASKLSTPPQQAPPAMQNGPMQPGMTQGPPMPGFADGGIVPRGWMNAGIPVNGFLPGSGYSLPDQAAMMSGRSGLQGGAEALLRQIIELSQQPESTTRPEIIRGERAQRAVTMSPEEILAAQAKFQSADRYGDILERVAAMEADANKRGKMSPWEMMMTAGLSMAAAPTASLGRAVATGGLAVLTERQGRIDQKAEQLRQLLGMRAGVEDQRTRNDRAGLESAMEYGRRTDAANLEQTTAQNALDRDATRAINEQNLRGWLNDLGASDRRIGRLSQAVGAIGDLKKLYEQQKAQPPRITEHNGDLVSVGPDGAVQVLRKGEAKPERMTYGDRKAARDERVSDLAATAIQLYGADAPNAKERVSRIRRGVMKDQTIPESMRGAVIREALTQMNMERLVTQEGMNPFMQMMVGGGLTPPQSGDLPANAPVKPVK